MKECNICGRKFDNNFGVSSHIKRCADNKNFLDKYNLSSSKLEEQYQELGSVILFKEKFPYWDSLQQYYFLFKSLGVKVSVKYAANHKNVKNKSKQTRIKRTGYEHNFSKNSPSRIKFEKNLLEKEGITNVFQRESVKEKIQETLLEKYGKEFYTKHNGVARGKNIISKLNLVVFEILKNNDISFCIEYKIPKSKTKYYAYDILIDDNKIIEVNGDYWHGNPECYLENDIILKNTHSEILVKDKWHQDKEKIEFAKQNNYEVLVIWEKDLKHNLEDTTKRIINYARSKNKINKKNSANG